MALRFMDGFDHYTAAQIARKWTIVPSPATIGAGRFGGGCLNFGNSFRYVLRTIDAQATWIVGVAYQRSGLSSPGAFLQILDATSVQVDLRIDAGGRLVVTRNGTTLATSSPAISATFWYYIEMKVTIDPSAGAYEVRVNGIPWIGPTTGANTRATSNSSANQVALFNSSNSNEYWDDFYACDATGSVNNTFLGDVKVVPLYPSGAGTTTQFTPSAGANYTCVNESTPNDDTSYVETSTPSQIDTYAMGDLAASITSVKGVQTSICARKTDAGSRNLAPMLRSSGTNYPGTTLVLLDSYVIYTEVKENDPATSLPWAVSAVNAVEAGMTLIS